MSQAPQVVAFPSKSPKAKSPSRKAAKQINRQAIAATALGGVAVALAALSLNDLASGIALVSPNVATWQAWALAVGVDCSFIATELIALTIGDKLRKTIARYSQGLIAGTMIGSAIMNAFAFAHGVTGWQAYAAGFEGAVIPALIFVATKIATTVWIDSHSRA
jgi:hypothetical protein